MSYEGKQEMRYYLQELRNHGRGVLTDDDIASLLEQGNRETVLQDVAGLVPYILQKYWPTLQDQSYYPDIIQEGNIGLLSAMDSWQQGKGSSFITWAYRYIKSAMSREIDRQFRYAGHHVSHDFADEYGDTDTARPETLELPNVSDAGEGEECDGAGAREARWIAEYEGIKDQLPPSDSVLLDLLKEGWTQHEIAGFFRISQPTANRRIAALETFVNKIHANVL